MAIDRADDGDARLSRLEERVAVLEERSDAAAPVGLPGSEAAAASVSDASDNSAGPRTSATDERFWALEGLKARAAGSSAVLFTGAVTLPTDEQFEWQQGFDADMLLDSDTDISATTEVLAALAHPVRLVLLRAILGGVRTVSDLGSLEGLGTSGQIYHHVRQLVATGWLRSASRGQYQVPGTRVVPLLVILAAAQR